MVSDERRLHPLSFLFAIQESAKQFLVPAIVALFAAGGRSSWEIWTAFVVVPLALVALGRALSVRYRFDETEFVMRSGFIFKRVRHIPYDRIQNVDAVENVLHRLFGVMEVRIETGGGSETEATLRVVDREALQEIRTHVFARRSGAVPADAAAVRQPELSSSVVLLALPPREIMLFGLIHGKGMLVVGALFGLLWETGLMDRIGSESFGEGRARGVVRNLLLSVFEDTALPIWQILVTVAGFVLLLTLFRVASAIWTFITYYGFTLSRSGDDLRCEYGLLTRVASTIPLHRIQEVTVREGPWHRLGKRVSIAVQTAGGKVTGEEAARSRQWLAPLLRRDDIPRLLDVVIADAPIHPAWQPVQARGARREFVRLMVFVVPLSIAALYWLELRGLLVAGFLIAWAVLYARRSVAAMRWTTAGNAVQFRSGWIWRKWLMASLGKVQAVSRHETPFDRRHRMASIFVDTAGRARVDYSIHIPYLAASDASALASHLATTAAETEFRW